MVELNPTDTPPGPSPISAELAACLPGFFLPHLLALLLFSFGLYFPKCCSTHAALFVLVRPSLASRRPPRSCLAASIDSRFRRPPFHTKDQRVRRSPKRQPWHDNNMLLDKTGCPETDVHHPHYRITILVDP